MWGGGGPLPVPLLTLLENMPLPPKLWQDPFFLANVVSKVAFYRFFFFFKNRGSILHYRLVHFHPRPNRPEQCQLHENSVQELLIFILLRIIICSGVNGFSPNSHVWKGVWVVLIVLRLTLSFSGTFCTCLSILTENTNSLFTVMEVLFKTSI